MAAGVGEGAPRGFKDDGTVMYLDLRQSWLHDRKHLSKLFELWTSKNESYYE